MIDAIILDWAGTLADDVELTLEATNRTLEHFGGPRVDLETYRREFRIPVLGFYERYVPGVSLEAIDEVFFSHYERLVRDLPLFENVDLLLGLAAHRGLRVFLCSTVPEPLLDAALSAKGLRGRVEAIYGGASDKRPVLPRIVQERGLVPDRTLFVGDARHDIEAGHGARVRTGAAAYGYSPRADLLEENPDYVFDSVGELIDVLDREQLIATVPKVISTVGGFLLDEAGRILMVQTRKWSYSWGIPGGKIDYGETMEAAFRREMKEEVGLELDDPQFLMIQDCIESEEFKEPRHFLLINYVARARDPESWRANYELEDCRWTSVEEALALRLNRPTRIALDEALRQGLIGNET